MPLRSVKMKRFIFGFQRRVWCPKWTPLSSSCFMLTTAIAASLICARPVAALLGSDAGTGWCAALASGRATHPAVARRDRGGDCPAEAGRGRAKSTRRNGPHRQAYASRSPVLRPVFPSRGPLHRSGRCPAAGRTTAQCRAMPGRLLVPLLVLCTVAVAAPAAAAPARPAATPWSAPLEGALRVTRPFDPPPDPFGPGHRGVDLAGAPGAPVLAAGDGIVAFAGMVAGRPVVSIAHRGGLRTTYEPVQPSVAAGRPVARGSPIGTLSGDHPGCPVPACLHWGLRRGGTYLDP